MLLHRAIAVALVTLACTTTAGPSPSATAASPAATASTAPSATATVRPATRLAVLLGSSGSDVPTYRVLLVDGSGRTVASATAPRPLGGGVNLPFVSASTARVYYSDGHDAIRSLDAGGRTELVRTLAGGTSTRTVFAVSPDDSRIALATMRYTPIGGGFDVAYLGLTVEPLRGGARTTLRPAQDHVTNDVAIPVGWAEDGLLVGIAPSWVQNPGYLTPSSATSYEVVDAQTGAARTRIAPSGCVLTGPPVRAGSACLPLAGTTVTQYDWRGAAVATYRSDRELRPYAAVAPGGARVVVPNDRAQLIVFGPGGATAATALTGKPIGWLDDEHLVFANERGDPDSVAIYDVVTRAVARVDAAVITQPFATTFATLPDSLR